MDKKGKLIIGKPYEIMVRDEGRIIKISGNRLTEDDVKEFIEEGFIKKDDVEFAKNEFEYPSFDEVVASINSKFVGWYGFVKKLYKTYPSIAFSLILKEYSSLARAQHPLKIGDTAYVVSLTNFKPFDFKLERGVNYDALSYFPSAELAREATKQILAGLYQYGEPKN